MCTVYEKRSNIWVATQPKGKATIQFEKIWFGNGNRFWHIMLVFVILQYNNIFIIPQMNRMCFILHNGFPVLFCFAILALPFCPFLSCSEQFRATLLVCFTSLQLTLIFNIQRISVNRSFYYKYNERTSTSASFVKWLFPASFGIINIW